MSRYEFQIQSCIDIVVEGESVEDARGQLLHNLMNYAEEMFRDCYISNGRKKE